MGSVLDGVVVIDLTTGMAGSITTMLLADYGARVIMAESDPDDGSVPTNPSPVWRRGKESIRLDPLSDEGRATLRNLIAVADVVVEDLAPGVAEQRRMEYRHLGRSNARLIWCSITGYGRTSVARDRPALDSLVQARSGLQDEQPGLRAGPVFLHAPLPSYGAALLACTAVNAALHVREASGHGQHVETSLMQGALLWTTMIWNRTGTPAPALTELFKFKDHHFVSPPFEGADGQWFHPMPNAIPVALRLLGRDPGELPAAEGRVIPDYELRSAYYAQLRAMYRSLPAHTWVEALRANEIYTQMVGTIDQLFESPQAIENRVVIETSVPGIGKVRQFGRAYHLESSDEPIPGAPPKVGRDDEAIRQWLTAGGSATSLARAAAPVGVTGELRSPLEGVRVLDFGRALAGPFGPMILGQLGADVIKINTVDEARPERNAGDVVWAGSGRGKRSIAVDLKTSQGQEIVHRLIAGADVLHYNLRMGVAERMGIAYEQVRSINPQIIYCHTTAYGETGPMATWPGSDQMGQALSGLEYEQGATRAGGCPTWYRFGMCDAATGMLSVLGVLQALYHRDRTGEGQRVETNILNASAFLMSEAYVVAGSVRSTRSLDRNQLGLGALERLYKTAAGWICIVAGDDRGWTNLATALGVPELARDERFRSARARTIHDLELVEVLEPVFAERSAEEWFKVLDGHGVPCEVSPHGRGVDWFDDPDARASGWVVEHSHPVYGRLEQPGDFISFSRSAAPRPGPLPRIGEHTEKVLSELSFSTSEIASLRHQGVIN